MSETKPITVDPEVLANLQTPTPESARKTRQGPKQHDGDCQKNYGVCQLRHKDLTYVDARYVQGVLDSELGPANWQNEYVMGAGGKVACRIGIYVEDRGWVWKGDGAGETDIEGEKGSFSDAFKRAAVSWGIARDLYGESSVASQPTSATLTPAAVERPPLPVGTVPYQERDAEDAASCPTHGTLWVLKPGGVARATNKPYGPFWACASTERPYCKDKPGRAWVDEQAKLADDLPF